MNSALIGLECVRCKSSYSTDRILPGCPRCSAEGRPANVITKYDQDKAYPAFIEDLDSAERLGIWRYRALLPLDPRAATGLQAGGTPLIRARNLQDVVPVRGLWIKDESRNPTWSFKDRAAEIAAAHAKELGSQALIVASTGNAAAATAAAANRVGLPAIVLFAEGVDPIMSAFVRSYGAMVVSTATKKDRWKLMKHAVEEWGLYPCSNYVVPPVGNNPFMSDGYKSTGYEIWEQLGRRTPDWIFAPVGHADNLFGIHRAFLDLEAMDRGASPKLFGGEVYGSLTRAIRDRLESPEEMPVDRTTVAFSIATAQSTFQALSAITRSRGGVNEVTDDEVLEAHRLMALREGIMMEGSSASGFAALLQEVAKGHIDSDSDVVLVCTSAGIKSLEVTQPEASNIPSVRDPDDLTRILRDEWDFMPQQADDKERA